MTAKIYNVAFALALAAIAVVAFSGEAQARGVGGYSGKPQSSAQASYFSETYGAVYVNQFVSSAVQWQVANPVDAATTYTPTIYVYNAGTMSCNACESSSTGSASCTSNLNFGVGFHGQSPGSVTVPGAGFLFTNCFMYENDTWYSVTW